MVIALTIVHVLVCLFLIGVVLLQSGKAADLAGAFGGMGSQTAFGPRGSATVLSKATTISAVLFMFTSLSLSIVATRSGGSANSVLDKTTKPASTSAPAVTPEQDPSKMPSMTITPEGSPDQSITVPLPTAEEVKKQQEERAKKKGASTGTVNIPGQTPAAPPKQ